MAFLLLLTASLIFFLFLFLHHRSKKTSVLLPPGPRGLPLIGNLHQLEKAAPHRHLWRLSQRYGPLMSLRLGSRQALVVSSAKMAEQVMKTHDFQFCSRPSLLVQQKLSYNGLDLAFSPYNAYWRELRKISGVHLFNPKMVHCFHPVREEEVAYTIQKIAKESSSCKPINLSEAMMVLTNSIICRIAFGKSYEDQESERSRFHYLLHEAQALFAGFFVSDYLPFLGWIDRLTGAISRLEKVYTELDEFYQELIDEHLDQSRGKPEQEDIIDVLLRILESKESNIDFTMNNIKAMLMVIFIAGTDTAAAAVIWVMTFLMKNPKAMKKAQQEVRNLVGSKRLVDETDTQKLPYLKAVVKESFRLQPPVPLLVPRETMEKCNIEGYEIPAKTLVYVNVWAIGRDSEAWENPEDFCPERFLGSSIDYKGQDFELIPFGSGRRICPGIHLGVAMVELAVANLLYRFNWELPPGIQEEDVDLEASPGITMHKKDPLCLFAKEFM